MDMILHKARNAIIKARDAFIRKGRDTIHKRDEDTMGIAERPQRGEQTTNRVPKSEQGYGLDLTDSEGPRNISMEVNDRPAVFAPMNHQCKQSEAREKVQQNAEARRSAAMQQPQTLQQGVARSVAQGTGGAHADPTYGSGGARGGVADPLAGRGPVPVSQGGSTAGYVDSLQMSSYVEPPTRQGDISPDVGAVTQANTPSKQIIQGNSGPSELERMKDLKDKIEILNRTLKEERIKSQNLEYELKKEQSARQSAEQKLETEKESYYNQARSNLNEYHSKLRRQIEAVTASQREQIASLYKKFQDLDGQVIQDIRDAAAEVDRGAREQIAETKEWITNVAERELERIYGDFSKRLYKSLEILYQHKYDHFATFVQNYFQCVDRLKEMIEFQTGVPELKEVCAQLEGLESSLGGVCEELGARLRFVDSGEEYNPHLHDLLDGKPPLGVRARVKRCVAPGVERLMDDGRNVVILHPLVEV